MIAEKCGNFKSMGVNLEILLKGSQNPATPLFYCNKNFMFFSHFLITTKMIMDGVCFFRRDITFRRRDN